MMHGMSSYSLSDLCSVSGVTPRTVRYYVSQGLLRPPTGSGPAARYDDGHRDRLRMIRRLQRDHLPLAEIRSRLDALTDAEVAGLLAEPPPPMDSAAEYIARLLAGRGVVPAPRPAPPPGPPITLQRAMAPPPARLLAMHAGVVPPDGVPVAEPEPPARATWERVTLSPDLELHIRRPLTREDARRVDRLIGLARQILRGEEP